MFSNRSKRLFVSAILGTLYSIYLVAYFSNAISSSEGAEQVGAGIATALVTPHMVLVVLATIFSWLGFSLKKAGFALVGAILFSVAAAVFLPYIIFVLPMIILGYAGYAKQKKLTIA